MLTMVIEEVVPVVAIVMQLNGGNDPIRNLRLQETIHQKTI